MRGKLKMVLLTAFLCLVIGSQSVEKVQASVNYEACRHLCGTKVNRYEEERLLDISYIRKCTEHTNCEICYVKYGLFSVVSCESPGCKGYNPEGTLIRSWYRDDAHVNYVP